jgi:hypothetical protein
MKSKGRISETVSDDPVLTELTQIKRLLVLLLLKAGASQAEIGIALESSQSTVSKQFRFGDLTPIAITAEAR